MSRKRKLFNVKERCRICLVDEGCMTNLFDETLQSKLTDLSKTTSIIVKDEHGLPNIICHVCLYKLDMWNEFKEQFIRSNQLLLSQLELVDASDNEELQSQKLCTDLQKSGDDSLSSSSDKEKQKNDLPALISLGLTSKDIATAQKALKDIYISEDDITSSKDSSQKANDKKFMNNEGEKNDYSSQFVSKLSSVSTKVKPLIGKRNKIMEKRKASTKRWVARKKALLAATGESVTDSDSMASDSTQMSSVQKIRAKSSLEIEVERQKRLVKALKNLEADIADEYAAKHNRVDYVSRDSDTDMQRRSLKDINSDNSTTECNDTSINEKIKQDIGKRDKVFDSLETKENSSVTLLAKNNKNKLRKKDNIIDEDTFVPCSVKSKIDVGDAMYIITSTLTLVDTPHSNKANVKSFSEERQNGTVEHSSQEKNTDIIDAVQLRRINPTPIDSNEKKCIERCLSIDVEGTEIEPLKCVQTEIADFVEKTMKNGLFVSSGDELKKIKDGNVWRNSYSTLEGQLKCIIRKTIRRNFESSVIRSCNSGCDLHSGRLSPGFVKEAMTSKKYQPKVVIKRLDIVKECKLWKVNNAHLAIKRTVKSKLGGPFSMVSHKRQSVPPIRYSDYNTSALDSDSYLSEEIELCESSRTENVNMQKLRDSKKQNNMSRSGDDTKVLDANVRRNELKVEVQENIFKVSSPYGEKHVCGVCEQSFNNCGDAIMHVRMHKTDTASIPRPNKHKMMRCKRCHEIVEARYVKAHICKSTRQQIHKCYVCNSTFRMEKLLVRHLESHDQSEFNIENITKSESQKLKGINVLLNTKEVACIKSDNKQVLKSQNSLLRKVDSSRMKMSNAQLEKSRTAKGRDVSVVEKPKETYTCFVCDKMFTDEEILKDHLQKHCDDISEDDQSPGKEQYQCAICGDSLDSEDALEEHVEKHLFDEGDDNPNLINIANENEKSKDETYRCLQCDETFNSEMLLEMHMQAHEEEAAIAEWEKQGIKTYKYQCMICDELFEVEDELSDHLDTHYGSSHVCQLCDKPFSSLGDLQKHVATH